MDQTDERGVPGRAHEEQPADRGRPVLPGAVETGQPLDTVKRRPATGPPDFGGHTGSPEGPSGTDLTNPQTVEEMDADTVQPAPTGGDMADISGATHGG